MGETFGNYELLEKVAVGGMAEIFRARSVHGQGVAKTVCIKRIHPALSSDGVFVAMFIEEARLGVSMVHSNIVPVFDFGYVDGHYYLAMEWVEGLDLATLNGRARVVEMGWPPELAVHIIVEVLEGLAYAHQKRDDQGRPLELVHRDVSPSNILLSLDGQVKLLDFGIARSEAREWQTRTGVVKGKLGYMSPEQACGASVDARADVWACGAVLYELLSGVRLRDERRALADPELDAIVRRAIETIPDKRHGSARELQAELMNVLDARRTRPRAGDLAEFIDRVRRAAAPGTNWDMQSSGVEQHLAAALEAAKADSVDPVARTDAQQVTVRLADEGVEKAPAATLVLEESPPHKARSRAKMVGIAAIAAITVVAAVIAAWWFFAPRDPVPVAAANGGPTTGPVAAGAPDAGTAGAADPPRLAPRDAGAAAEVAPPVEVAPKPAPRPKDHGRAVPAAPRKALLSVNTDPWANMVLDRKPIGETPTKTPREISPGKHVLVLTTLSGATRTLVFSVKAGEHKRIRETF